MPNSLLQQLTLAGSRLQHITDTPQLDAEVLLCHYLNKSRSYLRAWPEAQLSANDCDAYQQLISQRQQGTPIAYLTGHREFWSREFNVNPNVLIPRADSELLIELCLNRIDTDCPGKLIDLGTGSGILAITLAAERPLCHVTATDISAAALQVATENARQLAISNISFQQSNWFATITNQDFDLILSNPPYIAENDAHLQQGDLRFEPQSALISAEQGLKDIRLLAEQARSHLKNHGHLLIEHGYNQADGVQTLFKTQGYQHIETHRDLSGQPRVTSGIWITA
jgi:release factor glutamine methyltransferase